MRRLRLLALALLVGAAGFGCARGVTLNPDGGQSYAVNVINEMPHAMIIYVDDGGDTPRLLGTVAAQRQERFIVATVDRPTVTLIATDEADTHTVRRTVMLVPGTTVDVRIN